ncbi:MAG: carbonic anhydrase [Fibromonadaceae bacterium]|jgi:carbonic anhydrase|nr:carbonic anhydrase [Fibromonadaceae bacterium]
MADTSKLVHTWQTALQHLKDGNKRYVESMTITRNISLEQREKLESGQEPFAIIVTCSDSRVSPEIYFDQQLGHIFVIRNAGNIADSTTLGSIEFAAEYLKSPLIVVVGHSSCGAVAGAFGEDKYSENLQTIIDTIRPNIKSAKSADEAIHVNIAHVVSLIKENKIVQKMATTVVGAYYNIKSGEVLF